MNMRTWIGTAAIAFLSWAAVAEEKDVYRQFVDISVDRNIPLSIDIWANKIFEGEDDKKFLPVIEDFVNSTFSDSFRERTANTYRRIFSKEEMQILAENLMTQICAPIFNTDFIERASGNKSISKEDKISVDRCIAGLQDIDNAEEKLNKLAAINGEFYDASFNVHFEEFIEKLKQQKLIFYIADETRKTLPFIFDEELTWFDIVGEYLVLEYLYTFNDVFREGEKYDFDRESVLNDVCREFKTHFRDYVSVRYLVFDLDSKRVGEATIKLSECS
ncbi:hypothetical protein L4D15_16185 [Enterovibrio norvegicus]|uniref:Uncharacterized protein n=1 Tax=Enterovibrio norvegicus DSM 15893 TaxID=1121869 RepID=A0A1I5VC80_9GAMM|nr:hypothetical protein [Enterovibrio norvegicus]SFQ05085.1 hypothetical protein SAMN03084138_03894 [Enterovibrio norvegicus DSM 15893]